MAVPPERVTVEEAAKVVKAPVFAVVAPTVPLMLKLAAVPVILVPTNALGVPRAGVTKVGLVDRTTEPVPVEVVTPVPPLATAKVPDKVIVPDVVIGPPEVVRPVVPPDTSTLVTVPNGFVPQEVLEPSVVRYLPLLPVWLGASALKAALAVIWPVPPFARPKVPVTPVVKGKPVAFVNTPLEGVPSAGVTKTGDVANTLAPEPVSSVRAVSS